MDKADKNLDIPSSLSFLSEEEYLMYKDALDNGVKSIAPSLQAQMFELFLDGYDCKEISKQNPHFSEKDILYCRIKYKWDNERDLYAFKLRDLVKKRLEQTKLESIEYITNMLAVHHKVSKDQMLRYLQSGKEEDIPTQWIKNPNSYKNVIEILQKLTGEDKVTKQQIYSTSEITINDKTMKNVENLDKKTILRKAAKKGKEQ